jgi:hypothetical protein
MLTLCIGKAIVVKPTDFVDNTLDDVKTKNGVGDLPLDPVPVSRMLHLHTNSAAIT